MEISSSYSLFTVLLCMYVIDKIYWNIIMLCFKLEQTHKFSEEKNYFSLATK